MAIGNSWFVHFKHRLIAHLTRTKWLRSEGVFSTKLNRVTLITNLKTVTTLAQPYHRKRATNHLQRMKRILRLCFFYMSPIKKLSFPVFLQPFSLSWETQKCRGIQDRRCKIEWIKKEPPADWGKRLMTKRRNIAYSLWLTLQASVRQIKI